MNDKQKLEARKWWDSLPTPQPPKPIDEAICGFCEKARGKCDFLTLRSHDNLCASGKILKAAILAEIRKKVEGMSVKYHEDEILDPAWVEEAVKQDVLQLLAP